MKRTKYQRGRTIARVLWRRVREWSGIGRPAPKREPVYRAPVDMTGDAPIRAMVRWGENALEQGHELLVLDLTDSADMDSGLVAGIILLSRRIHSAHARLKLVGYSEQFEMLMKIYKLWGPLARTGVILEPYGKPVRRHTTWNEDARAIEAQDAADSAAAPRESKGESTMSSTRSVLDAPPRPATG